MSRLPTGFATVDPPDVWVRPRASCRPDVLARPLDALRGVGPTLDRRLAKLGLRTIDDLLKHAPRRYEPSLLSDALSTCSPRTTLPLRESSKT